MRSKDANEFLTYMGTSVQTLTLDAVENGTLCGKMNLADILSRTPNLQTLIFKGGSYYDPTPTYRLTLSALRSVKLFCQYTSVKDMEFVLNSASNLESFDGAWRLDDLSPIVETKKIHAVKKWCPTKFLFPGGLVRLVAESKGDELKLSELVVNIRDSLIDSSGICPELLWKCFLQLLNTNTIQKLILNCSKYPANASFPLNMHRVKELILMPITNPGKMKHFPIGINLNATFPCLRTLSLYDESYHVCCAGANWDHCFPLSSVDGTVGTLSSVTTLNLRQKSVSIRMLRAMKRICPNVRQLEICIHEELDKNRLIEELCGEWRNLSTLSIDLIYKSDELVSLDSAFTGLKTENLENLKAGQTLTEREKLKWVEDTRYTLWIGNMTGEVLYNLNQKLSNFFSLLFRLGLKQLNIKYDVPYNPSRSLIPFTEYSGLYAFNLMADLEVNLHYQTKTGFTQSDGKFQRLFKT